MSVGARRAAPSRVLACAVVALQLAWAVTAAEHGSGVQAQRGVSVSLRAKWEGTPIALEAAEFLADEDSAKFWEYVEGLQIGAPFSAGSGTCWSKILEQASRGLSHDFAKVLRTFLSTRHYSAKLEMYRSMARAAHQDACCWVQMGTVTSANASRLSAAVESALLSGERELLHPFDHIYQPNATSHAGDEALPGAVLYGTPGTACFAEMHAVMVHLAQRQLIRYALRPMLAQGCASEGVTPEAQHCLQLGTGEQLPLPGYGVELAIKNMEYKAIDDSSLKAKAQDDYSLGTEQGSTEIAGFLFHKLLDRKPEASRDLESFRDHLLSRQSSEEDETLKVWDLKDLGLQAVQRISSASDPLRLLMEVSQNFPALATSLSRIQVAPALRSEVKRIQQSLPSGTNFLLLNGLMVDVDSLELYSLVERVRHDSRLVDQFHLAGVPQSSVTKLLALRPAMVQEETAEMRVDIGTKPPVMFLNDLEKDRMYSGWPTSLQVLLMPSFGGQMQPVARNVFTAVYVMDPVHEKAHKIVRNIVNYWKQGVPVRFGVQLVPQSLLSRAIAALRDGQSLRPLVWDETDVSERLTRAFHMLYSAFGPSAAYTFLNSVRRGDPEDEDYGYGEMEEADEYADDVADSDASVVTWEDVSREFSITWSSAGSRATTKKAKLAAKLEASEAIAQLIEGSGYAAGIADSVIDAARSAVARGLLPETSEAGLLWFNGIIYWEHPEMALFAALQKEMQHIQRAIYQGKLTDGSNVASTILRNSGALPRYSALVLGKSSKRSVIEVNAEEAAGEAAREVPLKFHTALKSFQYLPGDGSHDTVKKATYWVVTDMGTAEGQSLVWSALKFLAGKHSTHARVAFIHCNDNHTPAVPILARLVRAATYLAADQDPEPLTRFLLALFQESTADTRMWMSSVETDEEIFQSAMAIADQSGPDSGTLMEELRSGSGSPEMVREHFSWLCGVLHSEFDVRRGTSGVVTNGRMVPSSGSVQGGLSEDDFHLMLVYADKAQHVGKIKSALSKGSTEQPAVTVSNQIMLVSNLLSRMGLRDDMQTDETSSQLAAVVGQLRSKKGALIAWEPTGGESSSAALDVTAVVDPLTAGAQKLVPLLLFLRATIAPRIRVWLNPALDLSELPLKSFFRFALPSVSAVAGNRSSAPHSAIDPSEDMPGPPLAAFASLPQKKILTQNVHAPEAWLIEPVRAIYDTDNLLLADLPEGELMANADYELEALIISGSCIDIGATSRKEMTPRGVQLHLGNGSAPHVADTLVMSNLGYFQLQASPGIWSLRLAPGASSTLYAVFSSMGITEDGNRQTSHGSQEASVVLSSMNGRHTTLLLKKKPGHAGDDVLTYKPTSEEVAIATGGEGGHPAGEGTDSGMWGKLVSMFKSDTPMQAHDSLVINVFTIASGHMYERLQKIMILSVLRHATAPVKFWFIKNYMSPQMKAFLPHFARAYGFEYELVTYKWPRWLHKQTEKQRIIWAYKILFLDVLFPLSLEKVIFVDADQIIRDDLRKLVEMDLHGAPYAYTPFCDNNKDMDGYRFWKSGFWKTHLQGLPYHISALYIVDLKRFRETAAGDQLRIIYDQLSKDPNSLANLDQDLPNYAQHQVKIFSLPQEWLWCESWCGNSTKHLAKTIDLCNNPMTKEPKLQGARRIVAEWPGYDEEVQSFTARVDAVLEGDMEESALPLSAESASDGNLPHETEGSYSEDGETEDKSEL